MSGPAIAFDATSTITGATGMARYARELAAALEQVEGGPEVRRFAAGRAVTPTLPHDPLVTRVRVPLRLLGRSWRWHGPPSVERLVGPVGSVHAAGPVLPTSRAPLVAVVHDLAPLAHPELHPRRHVDQLRRYLAGLRRTAAVIAVSAATANRLGPWSGRVPVHVVPNGRTPLPPATPPPLAGRPYVLAVGAPVPRKGFDVLLRAVARLGRADLAIALVGPPGSADEALAALAAELGLVERLHRATDVDDAALAGWYEHAAAVAVPSAAEGFSLPVVEAQAAGRVVVASDLEVHREVGAGATLLAPVGDVDALAEALAAALDDPAVAARAASDGPANAGRYTWEAAATATLAVHRGVASAGA